MENQPIIEARARELGVSSGIHPDDHVWNFVMEYPGFSSREDAINYYFTDGARSAKKFGDILSEFLEPERRPARVIEFASGYGCVTRHLRNNSEIDLVSCDIHPAAINFLKEGLGVESILSASCPEEFEPRRKFDVAFALSFFSHMPIATWARWLVKLSAAVEDGGLIIFTTHGYLSLPSMGNPPIPENGFWFAPKTEQFDIPSNEYGQTIVTSTFVQQNIASIPSIELVAFREGDWWSHQDTYIVRKRAAFGGPKRECNIERGVEITELLRQRDELGRIVEAVRTLVLGPVCD